jgi:hypothetical protein
MSFFKAIISDLRDKRLWPVAAALLVAVVAVPVVLSKATSGAPAPVAQLPSTGSGGTASGLPAVSVSTAPSEGKLTGNGRNPFNQFGGTTTTSGTSGTTAATTGTSTSASTSTSGSGTSTTSSSTGSGAGSSSTSGSSTTPSITTAPPKPAPTGLTATESYEVSLAITNSAGGLDTYSPLQRLSLLPSPSRPLLVELGVLKGGKRVLFAVEPGTVISGPGSCIPGPVDCEVLALAPGQTESLGEHSSSGNTRVALFAVTDVSAAKHDSESAANQARRATSALGRELLSQSTSSALSLFQFQPGVGAIVDLRNLVVGG